MPALFDKPSIAVTPFQRDFSRISFANGDVEICDRAFVTICHGSCPIFHFLNMGALAARLDASKRDEIKASLAFGKKKNAGLSRR